MGAFVAALGYGAAVTVALPATAAAQAAPAEAAVRDFLENAIVEMRLDAGSEMPIRTDTMEFLPAAEFMPGGGILVTEDMAAATMMGVAYEPWRWTLHEAGGAVRLRLVMGRRKADDPVFVLEGPISRFDGGRADVELRAVVEFDGESEEIVVRASLIALERFDRAALRQQRASLTGAWVLQRAGETEVAGAGTPAVTYTFGSDGSFAVETAGGETAGAPALPGMEALRGRWLTTGWAWTRPPFEAEPQAGPIIMVFRDEPAPHDGQRLVTADLFTLLEQRSDALVIKPFSLAADLGWITLQLRRHALPPGADAQTARRAGGADEPPLHAASATGMQSCMRGGASRFSCAGPLLEVLRR
jgi:hypothetical protein